MSIELVRWCYLSISSSAAPFSFCLQPFPASGSIPISQLFSSGGQSIGASASASVFPVYIQGWEIPFRIDWFDLPAVQGTLKSLIQPNSKASFLQCSAFFMVQLSYLICRGGKDGSDRWSKFLVLYQVSIRTRLLSRSSDLSLSSD